MKSNLQYWQGIYNSSEVPTFPSQFAVFVQSWLGSERCNILEVGCGNGRDSIFLSNAGHNVVVTDQCIGSDLKSISEGKSNLSYIEDDVLTAVVELKEHLDQSKKTVVYSRFFQHAINETVEAEMLTALSENLNEDARLFFEFRLLEDKDQFKVFGTDHYRRFQSDEEFIQRLKKSGFNCEYQCKGQGFARYGEEDPVVGRFVATPSIKSKLRIV